MKLLLDTHCLLWALMTPEKLSPRARGFILAPDNELLVSTACAWEIATKHRLGKLPEAGAVLSDYSGALQQLMAFELPISSAHALLAGQLTQAHRDPFDRILAAQATLEGLTLVTADRVFQMFAVTVLW